MTAILHRGAALLAALCAVLSMVVIQRAGAWDLGPAPQVAADAAVGLSYPLIALLVLTARDLGPGTRTLARVLLMCGLASGGAALATALSLTASESTPWARSLVQLQSWLWVPGFLPLLTLVPLLYPTGLLPGRVWRAAAWASVAGLVLLSLGVALYPEPFAGTVTHTKPVTALRPAQLLTAAAALLLVPAGVAAVASLVVRLRSSRGLERRQVAVLLSAAAVLIGVTAVQGPLPAPWDVLAQSGAVVLLPAAIGVAVTRHGLYELDVAVRRAAVLASLTVCLAGLYLSVLAVLRGVFDPGARVSAALAAGATGAAIQPLARRLTTGVDRLYYGDRADPYAVLSRLGGELATAPADMESVPQLVCRTVVESLRLPGAELHLTSGAAVDRVATAGRLADARATRVPLQHRGEAIGWLVVSPRSGEAGLDPRDHDVVVSVAAQAAPALAALQLRRQLQRSRELLVTAREAERRSLRRDLHDGVGAALAGLRLQIESAQALVEDPAARLLQHASDGVSSAVDEVRSLCEGLRPPAIDDLGLPTALRMLGERVTTPGLDVHVRVADELVLGGAAAEAAVYRIVAEALANVVKHAGASTASVDVLTEDDHVQVVVRDDGRGPAPQPRAAPGTGLGADSMRQRAEELGGHLVVGVDPDRHGTLVTATIPLVKEPLP